MGHHFFLAVYKWRYEQINLCNDNMQNLFTSEIEQPSSSGNLTVPSRTTACFSSS